MDNLIEKINAKGQEIKHDKMNKLKEERESVLVNVVKIKELAPRIAQLWDICQTLLDNGFPLGKVSSHMGFPYYEFETDGIFHGLGFYVRRTSFALRGKIVGFGIEGGGCDGTSALINKSGQLGYYNGKREFVARSIDDKHFLSNGDNYAPSVGKLFQDKAYASKLRAIVAGFDNFENEVIEYANEIANK